MDEFIATATDLTKEDGQPLSGFCSAKLSTQCQHNLSRKWEKVGESDEKRRFAPQFLGSSIFHPSKLKQFRAWRCCFVVSFREVSELCTKGQGQRSWPPVSWALPALASMNSSGQGLSQGCVL